MGFWVEVVSLGVLSIVHAASRIAVKSSVILFPKACSLWVLQASLFILMFLKELGEVPGSRRLSFPENTGACLPSSPLRAGRCLLARELCARSIVRVLPPQLRHRCLDSGLHTALVLLPSATSGLCSRFGYCAQNGCQHLHTNLPCGRTPRSRPPLPGVVEHIQPPRGGESLGCLRFCHPWPCQGEHGHAPGAAGTWSASLNSGSRASFPGGVSSAVLLEGLCVVWIQVFCQMCLLLILFPVFDFCFLVAFFDELILAW